VGLEIEEQRSNREPQPEIIDVASGVLPVYCNVTIPANEQNPSGRRRASSSCPPTVRIFGASNLAFSEQTNSSLVIATG